MPDAGLMQPIARRSEAGRDVSPLRVSEMIGDSMLPTLRPGQRVLVDLDDLIPSPPGIFEIWDGIAIVFKRLEYIANSKPARVRVSCDNSKYPARQLRLSELVIRGRIIGTWQRL